MKVIFRNSSLVFQSESVDPTENLWAVASAAPAGTGIELVDGYDNCFIQVMPGQKYSIVFTKAGSTGNNRLFKSVSGIATQLDNIIHEGPTTVEYTVSDVAGSYDSLWLRFIAVDSTVPPQIYRIK